MHLLITTMQSKRKFADVTIGGVKALGDGGLVLDMSRKRDDLQAFIGAGYYCGRTLGRRCCWKLLKDRTWYLKTSQKVKVWSFWKSRKNVGRERCLGSGHNSTSNARAKNTACFKAECGKSGNRRASIEGEKERTCYEVLTKTILEWKRRVGCIAIEKRILLQTNKEDSQRSSLTKTIQLEKRRCW